MYTDPGTLCDLFVAVAKRVAFLLPVSHCRVLQAGVRMKQVSSPAKLIYPSSAHDYSYYKSSTVAYFMIDEIKASLCRVLCPPSLASCAQ
jgi:kinesin family protein 4/21/27